MRAEEYVSKAQTPFFTGPKSTLMEDALMNGTNPGTIQAVFFLCGLRGGIMNKRNILSGISLSLLLSVTWQSASEAQTPDGVTPANEG
jgi:hypothetical protein